MEPKNELQKNAVALERRKELEMYQRALDVQWLNSRMEDGRMGRCLALIQREADMEKEFQERTDHAAIVNARAAKETSLGIEIAKVRREEACALLRRHYLRERDPSLRELTRRLQAGYVCRDQQLQMRSNEYRRLQDEAEEKHANAVLLSALYDNREAQELEQREKAARAAEHRHQLQRQLAAREQQRRCDYEETLVEKKMLEDIMRTLADEDQRELAQKQECRRRLQREMEASARARAAWRDKQRRVAVEEERRGERQRAQLADRSAAIVAERERKRLQKEAINEKITAKILADEAERRERENIIKALQEQEYLEKNANDDIRERANSEETRRQSKEAFTAQMENKKKLAAEARAQEADFRRETEAKLAADKQKDLQKEMEKRRRGRQHSEELLQQIRDNEERRRNERALEERSSRYEFLCDRAWREEVSRERQVIVSEHAAPLAGYLRAGALAAPAPARPAAPAPARRPKCNDQCRRIRNY